MRNWRDIEDGKQVRNVTTQLVLLPLSAPPLNAQQKAGAGQQHPHWQLSLRHKRQPAIAIAGLDALAAKGIHMARAAHIETKCRCREGRPWVSASRIRRLAATSLLVGVAFGSFSDATAQNAITCAAPSGVAPTGITITNTVPSVTVQWNAVAGARAYAVVRRNPDGTCWLLTSRSPTATSIEEPLPSIGGIYQYQVTVQTRRGSGVSQWFPFTVPPAAISSRTFSLTGFTGTGAAVAIASRTFTLAGFIASGTAVPVASRTLLLTGFTAIGSSVAVVSRTFSLVGFTAIGTSSAVAARTITTPGWTATGQSQP